MTRILAVDPGAAHSGIVVVDGSELLHHETVHAKDHAAYRLTISDKVHGLIDQYQVSVVAVENVVAPSWYMGGKASPIKPATLIGTAAVLGVVEAAAWAYGLTVTLVPPGGNGAGVFGSYPAELVSASERRVNWWQTKPAGKGALCHERSAWDVAWRASRMRRAA